MRGHVFDARMRRPLAVQTLGLQSVKRLVLSQMARQIVILKDVPTQGMDTEERGVGTHKHILRGGFSSMRPILAD
jgi:hypothetical protein